MYRFLEDLTIIEISAYVAAPLAGMTLAQLGARVIKIEPPGGQPDAKRWPLDPGGTSLFWLELNKGKELAALDLKNDRERAAFITLVERSSRILLVNVSLPDSGLFADLHRLIPDLISVQIVGRPDGTSAVDYTIQPATGFPDLTGPAGADRPMNSPLPAWDIITSYLATTTILAALQRRTRTGEGAQARIALSDVALATTCNLGILADYQKSGCVRPRSGNDIYGAFGRDFEILGGRRVMVAAITRRQWLNLVRALDIADALHQLELELGTDFSDEGCRYVHREPIAALMRPWFLARPLTEIGPHFDHCGVSWAPYQSMLETLKSVTRSVDDHPILESLDQPLIGAVTTAGIPIRLHRERRHPGRPAPSPTPI